MNGQPVVQTVGLTKQFPTASWFVRHSDAWAAVRGVDLSIAPGETLGLVGESGCGKSTLARLILRLIEPTAGRVYFEGQDLSQVTRHQLQYLRQKMQIVFQDPAAALNPRMTVREIIGEPLIIHRLSRRREREQRVQRLLARVALSAQCADRYPAQLSGGQQQRVGIARALACAPRFIVADEPLSALDCSTQARIINLLTRLQEEDGLSYLFITHDISTVRHISHRVAVMHQGQIVELGPTEQVLGDPQHPYTQLLLDCVLEPHPHGHRPTRSRP